jgi:hypothetical protein
MWESDAILRRRKRLVGFTKMGKSYLQGMGRMPLLGNMYMRKSNRKFRRSTMVDFGVADLKGGVM